LARLFRAEPGYPRDLDEPRRVLRLELGRARDLTGIEERVDLLCDGLADTRQGRDLPRPRELCDRHGRLPDCLRRVAVGDDPVDDRAVQLVEVSELVEVRGYFGVSHVPRLG